MNEDYALSGIVAKPAVHLAVIPAYMASFNPSSDGKRYGEAVLTVARRTALNEGCQNL